MSSLFSLKRNKIACLTVLLSLSACQTIHTRDELKGSKPQISPANPVQGASVNNLPTNSNADSNIVPPFQAPNTPMPVVTAPMPAMPKIGVILGAGGAKTYAHIGFLQELTKFKVPLYAIAGIEFGAPIAGLYANKEFANDVEWQMFKIKEEDLLKKGFLSGSQKPTDAKVIEEFAKTNFSKLRVEDFKLPFACPAYNMAKNQVYVMNKGGLDALLPYCWPYPPMFKSYKSNVSAVRDVKVLADFLRSRGANYIVFVNVLNPTQRKSFVGDADSMENILWTEVAGHYSRSTAGIDAVVTLNTDDYGILDFEKRREIMQKGSVSAEKALTTLVKKWGL